MEKLYIPEICGLGLHFEFDKFRITYAIILCFLWLMSVLFSTEYMKNHKNLCVFVRTALRRRSIFLPN